MKSKIQTNQVLMKGISIFILFIIMFSLFSTILVSYAGEFEEDNEEDIGLSETIVDDESLDSSIEETIEEIEINIEAMMKKLEDIETEENEYIAFRRILEDKQITTIEISKEFQLRALAIYVAEGNNCSGRTFVITRNIDLTSTVEWEPIGNSSMQFRGTLDGRGYTISGMTITTKRSYAGLIGYLGKGGIVKNIKIGESNINIEANISSAINDLESRTAIKYRNVGAVVGATRNGQIINCINSADIIGGTNVGGIVGFAGDQSIIKDCINKGEIKGYSRVGGIVGHAVQSQEEKTTTEDRLNIQRCVNKGTVFAVATDVGGIVGNARYNTIISKCLNEGIVATNKNIVEVNVLGEKLTLEPQNVGGIVGATGGLDKHDYPDENGNYKAPTIIELCINDTNGKVYGYKEIGGIVGQLGNAHLGMSIVRYSINYSLNILATDKNLKGGIVGTIGYCNKEHEEHEILGNKCQTGRIYDSYYITDINKADYDKLEFNKKTTVQTKNLTDGSSIGAYGNINGSKGGQKYPNLAFRIIKSDEKYYYESRLYYIKTTGTVGTINRVLYEASSGKDNTVIWKRDNVAESIHTEKILYPKAGEWFSPNSSYYDSNNNVDETLLSTYQVWLKRATGSGRLEVNEDGKIVIDNKKPTATIVDISTRSGSTLAIPGEEIFFRVEYEENINYDRIKPELEFDILYNESSKIGTRRATFVGIDNNIAIFKYNIEDIDAGNPNDSTGHRIIGNIKINTGTSNSGAKLRDVFQNEADNSSINIDGESYSNNTIVILKNDSHVSKTYISDYLDIDAGVAYRFYGEESVNFRGTTAYLRNKFNVRVFVGANVQASISNTQEVLDNLKLYLKVSDTYKEVAFSGASEDITWDGTTTCINFKNISLDTEGEIEEVYLSTGGKIININSEEVEFKQSNTSADVYNIMLDNTAPNVQKRISSKTHYSVEDKIVIALDIYDNYALKEIEMDKLPILKIKFGSGEAKSVEANSVVNNADGKTAEVLYEYTLLEEDNGELEIEYDVNSTYKEISDIAGNKKDLTEEAFSFETNKKYADNTSPIVEISTNKSNPTNSDLIEYTFRFNEFVENFTVEDITVNNGEKVKEKITVDEEVIEQPKFVEVVEGLEYTLEVKPTITDGNEGLLQVIVEQNACQDIVGHENVKTESIIKVDKQAPIFIGLESYVESNETNISLNPEVDTVKQYYKEGEVVAIVATFTENIEKSTVPTLALQFSESGNAKGTVSAGPIKGNKITYTYKITDGDTGTLSVKGFTGKVVDTAGNETVVTKRGLEGDAIIVDTDAPSLKELNIVSPSTGTYKAGTTATIEAIYDEEVYVLENNEIKRVINELSPILKIKIGDGVEKTATAIGYGETEGKEDKTKIKYQYTIANEDNGLLVITSYANKENVKVSDIAGNEVTLDVNQKGNTINADTVRPEVTNITAEVENPTISNTGIYHKAGNEIKITVNFTEDVSAAKLGSRILIGFSEDENTEPTEYKEVLDLNATSRVREYSYTIKDGDNGYLWVKVEEGHFDDEAGNTNIAEEATKIETVFADTTKPTLKIYEDTEVIQDGQKITVKATFSENVYNLVDEARTALNKNNAPKMVYGFGENGNLEVSASSVDGNVITYVITKENTISGEFYHAYFKGNVYDRAGNPCFKNNTDTTTPVLESVEISSNSGIYSPYCKEGREIYVTATFNEPIKAENMRLKAKIGETELTELLDGEIIKENETKVKFTYQVKAGDMGEFKIVDVCGDTEDTITEENADKTYGWVEDQHGNRNKIYNLSDEGVLATGIAEVDTKVPYITSIKAIADEKEIATYIKEEGKDAVITVGKTKANIVEYIVTYNEKVQYNYFDRISITNGEIKSVEYTNSAMNEYKVTVQTTVEGVQSLMINEGTVEDKAGNIDEFVRLDAVTVDFTKPTVRFISEYNGGVYVLPKNIDKVEIRPNVEISEDISRIKYKWDNEEFVEIETYSSSSDIAVPTKAFTEAGTHVLHIRVEDLAGNVTETNKTYKVVKSNISIDLSTNFYTNQDITATVTFGEGLTDNRKVTYKAEGSNEIKELKAGNVDENGGIQYRIETNGIIYVESTDRVGNKVFTEEEVLNIDKEAPEIIFSEIPYNVLKGESLDISIYTNEYVLISYSWDNENWEESQRYLTSVDITKSFEEVGEYTLYVKAKDKAGNESTNQLNINVTNLDFEVWGNIEDWTNQDVDLYVEYDGELASITVNETAIDIEKRVYVAKENGEYVFVITDKYGNTATKTEKVEKIDKVAPVISKVENEGKTITITATDTINEVEGSGVAEYAISKTTEVPAEWSESNVIKVTEDGTFYVWVKDNVGNITKAEEVVVVDTTAPTITFNYTLSNVTVGEPIGATILTNEEAKISYSWDNESWTISEEFITNVNTTYEPKVAKTYTLYAKATDKVGNQTEVKTLEFKVIEEIKLPEIIFEDLPTLQVDGVKYVKIPVDMTKETLTSKMNVEALCGATPEYTKLTKDGKLRTEAEITIEGVTKYIIVVNGDVNSDGKIDFVKDIIRANNYRLGMITLNTAQILAADINGNGKIEFIQDIISINNYRLGLIKSL